MCDGNGPLCDTMTRIKSIDKKLEYYQSVHSTPGADESCNSASSYYSVGSSGGAAAAGVPIGSNTKHMSKINHRSRQVAQKFDHHHQSPTDLSTSFIMAQSASNDTFSNSDKQRPNEFSSESSATTARCGSITTDSHMSNSARCAGSSSGGGAGCGSGGGSGGGVATASSNDPRSRSRDRRRYAINITSNPGYQVIVYYQL